MEYELYHYGIKGMKWGVRRYEKQKRQVEKLQQKRKDIYAAKGAASKAYRDISKDLYGKRAAMKLTKAKLDKDSVEQAIQKAKIRESKQIKKYGTGYSTGDTIRGVYGTKLSKKEINAIQINEFQSALRKSKVRRAVTTVSTIAAPAAIAAGTAYFNKNSYKIAARLSRDTVKNLNKGINAVNKGINFVNKYMGG